MTQKIERSRHWMRAASITAFMLLATIGCVAQIQNEPPPIFQGQTEPNRQEDAWELQQRKAMEKKANEQRQQDIQKDTDKLLQLATELKLAVDKSNQNTLSLDVIKKADQIEKLAKSVKDKMKGP